MEVQLVAQDGVTPVAKVKIAAQSKAVVWRFRVFFFRSPGVYAELPSVEFAWQ